MADADASEANVCVAVKIRPLVASELDEGCQTSLYVTPGQPQVSTGHHAGQHTFTYDHVFGEGGAPPDHLYRKCVAPLVAGLFKGYNATVFAYGQTGSGKTFTMGSEYRPGGRCAGVIPDAINDIFARTEAAKDSCITVRVSFVEIHKEEIKDLLLPSANGPRAAISIRETQAGGVALYGAVEREVRSREEMAEVLEMGTLCRSTASTSMNNRSSRSHAIFSITLEQRRTVTPSAATPTASCDAASTPGDDDGDDDDEGGGEEGDGVEDYLVAKMHLVDLAGSERAKRTKAEGARLREGIHINRGLLALGNVINAIVDAHKHVPYRDSKLTRLLQDSLGGNSRTVMIACVSPADSNFEESLNTLRYADRARHIRNKPVVNRDPVAAQLAVLRGTIAQLRSENAALKRAVSAAGGEGAVGEALAGGGGGRGGSEGGGLGRSALEGLVERLTQDNSGLEAENLRLKLEMEELRAENAAVTDRLHTAQAQCDLLRMNQAAAAAAAGGRGAAGGEEGAEAPPLPGLDIVKGYVSRIAGLERELQSLRSLAHLSLTRRRGHGVDPPRTPGGSSAGALDASAPGGPESLRSPLAHVESVAEGDDDDEGVPELAVEEEYFMAELAAHTLSQEKMKKEVALLQRQLEAKERKMVELLKNTGSVPALKQHYDRVLAELESQRDDLVAERKALMEKLAAVSAASEEERKRLETTYRDRLHTYDERLRELRRKERDFMAMQKLKQRTEEAHRRLSADITRLKQQKVSVQRQLDANAKQFAAWRQEREKELVQLRRQSRKDRATIQHLEAMHAKQNAVLQRKISDANAARKRIKELEEARKGRAAASATLAAQQQAATALAQQAGSSGMEIQPNTQAPMLRTDKDRREWLQKELELCNMSFEFRKVIDGELAERAEANRKLKELEKRLVLLDQLQPASPLLVGSGAAMTPVSPASAAAAVAGLGLAGGALEPEAREKLLAKKKELEEKVAYHHAQISELQMAWERQKSEEESRGGGAMDVRRWAGLRNVVECRELLRTLFRISVESKCLSNDLTVEVVRYSEENDVLRVQLDGSQRKCAQYRRVAAAMQAAAAHVVSAQHHGSVSAQDETDKQVDAVLEELHVVTRNTPAAVAGLQRGGHSHGGDGASLGGAGEAAAGGQGAEGGDVAMGEEAPDTPSGGRPMEPKALEFLSPVPSGVPPRNASTAGASQRYSSEAGESEHESGEEEEGEEEEEADGQVVVQGRRRSSAANVRPYVLDEGGPCSADEEEAEEEEDDDAFSGGSSDSDDDDDWDPSKATPAVRTRRATRRSSALAPATAGGSRRATQDDDAADGGGAGTAGAAPPPRRSSRRSGATAAAGGEEGSGGSGGAAVRGLDEAPVLDDINLKRYSAGHQTRLTKLTVAVLKDALKGHTIDGQRWHAGSKNRAALIEDYRRMLGFGHRAAQQQYQQQLAAMGSGGMVAATPAAARGSRDGSASRGRAAGSGGGIDISVGGAEPLGVRVPAPPGAEPCGEPGFTFSPHVSGASGGAALAAPHPSATPSVRRAPTPGAPNMWARSSLNPVPPPTSASREYSWASSLRSSLAHRSPAADGSSHGGGADAGGGGGGGSLHRTSGSGLHRTASGSGASPPVSSGNGSGGGSSSARRAVVWSTSEPPQLPHGAAPPIAIGPAGASPSGTSNSAPASATASAAALRESLDYRGAVLSPPQPSCSPRLAARASAATATGATSPRNTPLGTPVQASGSFALRSLGLGGKGSGMWSSGTPLPRERSVEGGENLQPGASPRTGGATPGSGKGTPLTNLYKEKAAAARERNAALRVHMSRNLDAPQNHGADGRSSAGGLPVGGPGGGVRTSAVSSSISSLSGAVDAARAAGLRDSGAANKKALPIWR